MLPTSITIGKLDLILEAERGSMLFNWTIEFPRIRQLT